MAKYDLTGHGFVREKKEIKYLTLYAMNFLEFPVTEESLLDICLIDGAFGYLEWRDAFCEMLETGHIRELENEDGKVYEITPKGREAAVIFEKQLKSTVRERAQRSVFRVIQQIKRNKSIVTSRTTSGDTMHVNLSIHDGDATLLGLRLYVANQRQASLLEKKFRKNAEKIYNDVLDLLFNSDEETPKEGEN